MKMTKSAALLALLFFPLVSYANDMGDSLTFSGRFAYFDRNITPGSARVLLDTGFSDAPKENYDSVIINGEMPDPNVRIEVFNPFSQSNGKWETMTVRGFKHGRFWAKFKFPKISRRAIKLRAVDNGVRQPHNFVIYDMEVYSDSDTIQSPPETPVIPEPPQITIPQRFIPRAEWNAKPAKEPYLQHEPNRFTLHHTQGRLPKNFEDAMREVQFVQDYHQNGRGWIDVGYHFMVDPEGNVFQGRPMNVKGAHVKNGNTGNVGISILGSYHPPINNIPSNKSLTAFTDLGKFLVSTYDISISSVYAHRELNPTSCPGDILYGMFQSLKETIFGVQPPQPPVIVPDTPAITPATPESLRQLLKAAGISGR